MTGFLQPPNPLRAVTFDLDGLMFNTEEIYQEVDREILARRGKATSVELHDQIMGRQAKVALQLMIDWHQLSDTVDDLLAESREIMQRLLPTRLAPMPGMVALLDALEASGIPRGIATSSGRESTSSILLRYQWEKRFSFVLTGESIEHSKPAPDVYLLAAEKHGVRPEEMLVLEDSQIGCQAAVAAGSYTVAVPAGRSRAHQFDGVHLVADSLRDERIYRALQLRQQC